MYDLRLKESELFSRRDITTELLCLAPSWVRWAYKHAHYDPL